jgi:succinate-acetate transporter protein
VLGLFGFGVATFIVAANVAGWYGNHTTTPGALAPFAMMAGGLAQFLAGMWAYRARDALATAMHGIWGSFWLAFGTLHILIASGAMSGPAVWYDDPALGWWFFALAIVTGFGAFAALAESLALFAVLGTLAAGSGIFVGALAFASESSATVAGWVFVFSAGFAFYTAGAMMLAATSGRTVLPLGNWNAQANVPGRAPMHPIELEWAEPGIRQGQ